MTNVFNKISTEASINKNDALGLLSDSIDTIELLSVAYKLRKKYFDKAVRIHILNNIIVILY